MGGRNIKKQAETPKIRVALLGTLGQARPPVIRTREGDSRKKRLKIDGWLVL